MLSFLLFRCVGFSVLCGSFVLFFVFWLVVVRPSLLATCFRFVMGLLVVDYKSLTPISDPVCILLLLMS